MATSEDQAATVASVNVGVVQEMVFRGQTRTTAIRKSPVPGPVAVGRLGVDGDHQADRRVHGGPLMAVYAYAAEDNAWWQAELGVAVGPGTFGENLTVRGVDLNGAVLGERWTVGETVLQVTEPRFPCWKLGVRMGDDQFPKRFLAARRPGTYLSVVREGRVAAGDRVQRHSQPGHPVTVGLIASLNHSDRPLALRLLKAVKTDPTQPDLQGLLDQTGLG